MSPRALNPISIINSISHTMAPISFPEAVRALTRGEIPLETATQAIYEQLTEKERLSLLDGDLQDFLLTVVREGYCHKPWSAGTIPRLQIPGLLFSDGPRSSLLGGKGTAFPTPSSRANSFDPELEQRIVSQPLLTRSTCSGIRLINPGRGNRCRVTLTRCKSFWWCLHQPCQTSWLGSCTRILWRGSPCSWHIRCRTIPWCHQECYGMCEALCVKLHGEYEIQD
jgi:hypothetical protein